MFIRTNRQSSYNHFYFLHILFLIQLYSEFLIIVHALNNNDNEAIIQLSVDSIHVVKSSDPRFASIEENVDDNEEKELLIALLTSFDDDYKNKKHIQIEKSSDIEDNEQISLTKNCTTSSSSTTATASFSSSSTSSSSIRFIPPLLDFGEQAIAMPRMQTVMIINDDIETIELHSLSGTTVQFYSSFFTQKTLSPNGGNTTINVYYLPRTVGLTKSTFTIKTNRGTLHYYVTGIGLPNPFHIRPLIGATIPLNSTFEYTIHFYNPYNYSIDINEIYTSDENLIIELLSYKNPKTKIIKTFEHKEQWHIEPYRIKPIIKLNYFGYKLDRLHGFYCIKTNSNDTIIVPVEINVSNQDNLYSNVDLIEFSSHGFIHSSARPINVPIYVINNGLNPVTITDVRVTVANINYATVHHEKIQVPNSIHQLTKVADLIMNPQLIPKDVKRIRGSVQIYTLSSSNNAEPTLQVPFRASVIHGSLDYDKETTFIYIPSSSSSDSAKEKTDECRPIKFFNKFTIPLIIYNVTSDKSELLSQYVKMNFYTPFVYAKPGHAVLPVCVNVLKRSLSSAPFANLEAALTLHTNLSFFHLPIYLYSGLLSLNLVTDGSNGGIKRNDTNPYEYFIASIPVNVTRIVKFLLINANPIEISIEQISLTLPKTTIKLAQMQLLNGSDTNVTVKSVYRKNDIIKLIIPAHHRAVFSLTIDGTSDPSYYHETITFKTRYETLVMNVKYRIISGSIELENKQALHIDVFPNRIGMVDLSIVNKFDEPTDVLRMEFPSFGKCFSFIWNSSAPGKLIIDADKPYRLGKLCFDMIPLCSSIQMPSESTCYCGLNNHPEFKQRWEQHVTTLNNYELDYTLVTKFRNLWKEWTSLVRKQRLHTNIWLITDQANVSWPVSIGFVWPSVLEHMSSPLSRTPVVLDFHLTLIDTTKTQNVIITNPSSSIIQYSVELTTNYDNKKIKKQTNSLTNNQIFDITTTSKRVELINGMYKFNLLPTEHVIFTASYRPKQSAKQEMYLVVRNNLTIIESILLRGEGGSGSLTVGYRKAGSSDIPIVLEMNEKQYQLCSNYLSTDGIRGNPIIQKIITLRNTGNMKAIIHDIAFGHSKCSGQGFSVSVCTDIEIEPNDRYDLRIRFQPDYTLAEIAETLTLHTNIGIMTFPIIVRIPQRVLATCYQIIPRPVWEVRVYWLCLCSISIILIYVLTIAVYEARRLYNDYVARVELRSRIPAINPAFVNLNDLTAAVQDEQKFRERIESRTTATNSISNKKESTKDETKPKDNELKAKRSNPSVNGTKDHGETSLKPSRTPDGSSTPVRSIATSPKPVTNKQRRSTTDNGQPKTSKHQHETSTKSQTSRVPKSQNTEQPTEVTSRSTTPPSNAPSTALISDEEKEPFVVARSKRVSGKTKESTTTSSPPAKTIPATDNVTPSQSTPPLPPPPPTTAPAPTSSSTVNSKPSIRSDMSEQRQNQQDLSRSTESLNDQQWHMVSSNRGIRKGTTTTTTTSNRRETTEESQTTNKTNKTPPTNSSENPVVSSSSSSTHASVSNQVSQSRRRRGRRSTRPPSPPPVPSLTKRQSLQSNTPLYINNRELAFRQLTEQLWAAGLPSSTTACSMSVRSRCSSAPPSERGGGDDDLTKIHWNNAYDDEQDNVIDWDEPDKPDEDFGRYVSQTEQCITETNGTNEWTQAPSSSLQPPPVNEIPSLLSIPTAPPTSSLSTSAIILPTVPQQKVTIPSTIIKDEIEPLPFPQHGPGPIQRPNKLTSPPTQQATSTATYVTNSIQPPETPDVLDQINRLLDHQNNPITPIPSTTNVNNSSIPMNDLSTPNLAWTTFSPNEWSSKYDSSWPLPTMQSPSVPLTTQVQNPFALISGLNEQRQAPNREEATVWSSVLGTVTPRLTSSSTRTQRASTWNELFQSTVPSATESTKPPMNNSWLKYWPAPDPSSVDGTLPNGHETETTNPFWNLSTLSNEPVVVRPTMTDSQQVPTTTWWPNTNSDENNNKSQINHLNDDTTNNRDQSRWDFAR